MAKIFIIGLLFSFYTIYVDEYFSNQTKTATLFNPQEYIYTYGIVEGQGLGLLYEALVLLIVMLYVCMLVFKFFPSIAFFIRVLRKSAYQIFLTLGVIVLLYIGIIVIANNLWGTRILYYRSFRWSFLFTYFIFEMGSSDAVTSSEFAKDRQAWALILIIFYIVVIIYQLMSVFIASIFDSHRRILLVEKEVQAQASKQGVVRPSMFREWLRGINPLSKPKDEKWDTRSKKNRYKKANLYKVS